MGGGEGGPQNILQLVIKASCVSVMVESSFRYSQAQLQSCSYIDIYVCI